MSARIRKWVICVSGFLQDRSKPTGMARLWRDLHDIVGPESQVLLLNWDDNVREYAEMIWQFSNESPEPAIAIFGYSWGGSTAVNLAAALRKRGLSVGCMVLSDPVYRHWWLPRRWTSMLDWMSIRVPDNVRKVVWFRQRENKPAGHDLVPADRTKTTIYPAVEATLTHQYMDDYRPFHMECHKCAAA